MARVTWPLAYQHPNAGPFVRAAKQGLSIVADLSHGEIAQPYEGVVLLEISCGSGQRKVALDYFDRTHVNERCAADVDVYFKMQHLREGYPDQSHVAPGGYVTGSLFLYRNWCRLRASHRRSRSQVDVFGRFGLRFSRDLRCRALALVSGDPRFTFAGGTKHTKESWYLREMARARVCIDLPGQGPFCFRLVELMAMGCCVIGPRHAARLPVELRPGIEIVHCADDLHDLPDLCAQYSADEDARTTIGDAAAAYFDRHLYPTQLARYYIETVRRFCEPSLGRELPTQRAE